MCSGAGSFYTTHRLLHIKLLFQVPLKFTRLHAEAIMPHTEATRRLVQTCTRRRAWLSRPEERCVITIVWTSGYDFWCQKLVGTGLSLELPGEHYARIAPRSGLASKFGIDVLAGVVDADFRGEIKVSLGWTNFHYLRYILCSDSSRESFWCNVRAAQGRPRGPADSGTYQPRKFCL